LNVTLAGCSHFGIGSSLAIACGIINALDARPAGVGS
jgi:hypothetical protein